MMIRTYARIAAVVLLAAATIGLVVLDWRASAVFFHLGLALIFGYVGFFLPDHGYIHRTVMGLGVLVLTAKVVAILGSWVAPMRILHGPIEISCLVVGITSILAAWYLPNGTRRRDQAEQRNEEASLVGRRGGDSSAEDQEQEPGYDREQE